jgi:uncharacterized protein YndB with AHSA1/START domain
MTTMTDDQAPRDAVVIERTFDAPVALIWRMWTDPDHFREWYGPGGASVPVASLDVRVGGTRRVCMIAGPSGNERRVWFTGEYREVAENERLVYTESMSDEDGNILSPSDLGLPAGHPATTEVTVELEDLGGSTRMVLTHAGIPQDSPGAAGWAMALDKLAARVVAEVAS